MNRRKNPGPILRIAYRLILGHRWLARGPRCRTFRKDSTPDTHQIQGIYVINLDRQVKRWIHMQRELHHLRDHNGRPLKEMTTRFPAIDATHEADTHNPSEIMTSYTLADQLFVEPHPSLPSIQNHENQHIQMSKQEIAVASSHVAVWRLVITGDHPYVLVVEDDVYFRRRFASVLDQAWADLLYAVSTPSDLDLLYLSYEEAKSGAAKEHVSEYLFRPLRGLWNLSGYVLSRKGANKLLDLLPVRGPVDLWINHHFNKLDVFATSTSIVEQRWDYRSDNSYSILPVLSRRGVLTQERPSLFKTPRLSSPVFAAGPTGTGLTSLAMALSMLGYRCCSDITELPKLEHENLFRRRTRRIFDAYVNIGSLTMDFCRLLRLYPNAKIIVTTVDENDHTKEDRTERGVVPPSQCLPSERSSPPITAALVRQLRQLSKNVLLLPTTERNRWTRLCLFLDCHAPASPYPNSPDRPPRRLSTQTSTGNHRPTSLDRLKFDKSPWIAPSKRGWRGISLDELAVNSPQGTVAVKRPGLSDVAPWRLLDDTFPSNLALFRPDNFMVAGGNIGILALRKEGTYVRDYTSASLCSRKAYQYGHFEAVIRPAGIPGVVTGMFLHRNSPRQEIDIEFIGRDTTKLLVNVYYNPGGEGAKFDYGYRGTPALIDLGFDASTDFHSYRMEWSPTLLCWFVDGRVVHERTNWNPTPIPCLPMHFYINLWPSRSRRLVGRLSDEDLPGHSHFKAVVHAGTQWPWPQGAPAS